MSSDLYNYGSISDSDDQSTDSEAEVQQTDNNKRRKKDATPNLEDFLPSEKRAKYTKKCGNEIPGQRLQFGDKNGKGNAQEVNLEEEDPDSDLEILREEAAHEVERLQKEQQRQDLLDAKKRDKAYRTAALKEAGAGDQDTWKDRQLVARSRAWLTKKSDKDVEDDDDDIEVALGDSSDDDSPAKYNNRQNQEEKPSTTPSGINNDTKSPNFTAPKALENALMIVVQDKFGHIIQCRVKRTGNLGKLIKGFTKQAVENARKGWMSAGAQCRFIFDGEIVKETDTPASLDLEDKDQFEVHYVESKSKVAENAD